MQVNAALKLLKSLSLIALLGLMPAVAHASTITYSLSGVDTSAGTLTGTIAVDTTTDLVTSAKITLNDTAAGSPVFTDIENVTASNGVSQAVIFDRADGSNSGRHIALYFNTANLSTGDLSICVRRGPCGLSGTLGSYSQVYLPNNIGGPLYLTSGELDPQSGLDSSLNYAATPEPPSLILLGTGIFFLAVLLASFSGRFAKTEQA